MSPAYDRRQMIAGIEYDARARMYAPSDREALAAAAGRLATRRPSASSTLPRGRPDSRRPSTRAAGARGELKIAEVTGWPTMHRSPLHMDCTE